MRISCRGCVQVLCKFIVIIMRISCIGCVQVLCQILGPTSSQTGAQMEMEILIYVPIMT